MTTILNGLLGGLVVGLVASTVTRFVTNSSPFAALVERTLGLDRSSRTRSILVGTIYGGLAGGLLLVLELFVLGALGVPPTPTEAFGVALAWSGLLLGVTSVAVALVRFEAVDRLPLRGILLYHLLYGLGLGLWIRSTWIT